MLKYKDILNGNIKVIRKEDEKIDFDYYENDLFKELYSNKNLVQNYGW